MTKEYGVRLKVVETPEGWRLMAVPDHGVGWAPIPMTPPRGTPGGALVEFAGALYELTHPVSPTPEGTAER